MEQKDWQLRALVVRLSISFRGDDEGGARTLVTRLAALQDMCVGLEAFFEEQEVAICCSVVLGAKRAGRRQGRPRGHGSLDAQVSVFTRSLHRRSVRPQQEAVLSQS